MGGGGGGFTGILVNHGKSAPDVCQNTCGSQHELCAGVYEVLEVMGCGLKCGVTSCCSPPMQFPPCLPYDVFVILASFIR